MLLQLTRFLPPKLVWVSGEVINNALYTNGTVLLDPDCHSEEYVSTGIQPADVEVWLCECVILHSLRPSPWNKFVTMTED